MRVPAAPITDLPVLLAPRPPSREDPCAAARGLAALSLMLPALAVLFCASLALAQGAAAPGREAALDVILRWLPVILWGFLLNVFVSFVSMALGTVIGVGFGLAQLSPVSLVSRLGWLATQFFRNAPWLVLLFYAMFLLPFEVTLFGLTIPFPAWVKAVIGLALPVAANISEVFRGGVQSIPLAQWESAEALAFSRSQTLWMIIIPQAFKRMIPPWMNVYAILTMATPLISIVGLQDSLTITRAALVAESRPELMIPLYLVLLLLFFVYSYPIARATLALERRFSVSA